MNRENYISYAKLFVFATLAVLFQNLISNIFVLNDIWYPDFTIIFIVLIGQIDGARKSILFGFYIGLLQDLSTDLLGMYALSKTLIGFIAAFFPYDVNYNRTKYVYSLLSITSIHHVVYYSLVFYGYQTFFNSLIKFMIPNMLYTVFLGIILYFIIEKWIVGYYGSRD